MRYLKIIASFFFAVMLGACAGPAPPSHYASELPRLDLQEYFNGTVEAWGMVQDRSGTVIKRFHVTIACKWDGDTGTLDEDFHYADGTRQRRVWTLHKQVDGSYVGTAPDVVGKATGVVAGNTLHWTYTLALPVDGKIYEIDFDDWMFLQDERVMLNRATMRKFGIRVGDITLSFMKRP